MSNKVFAHAWFLEPEIPVLPQLLSSQPPLGGIKEGELFSVKLDDKDIKSIAKRLKNGEVISEVEWIILLRSEERYQALSTVERESIVIIVWASLVKDELRYNKCLIKIVAGLARGFNAIADSLVTAFPKKITTYQQNDTKTKTDVVRSLLQQDYLRCGRAVLRINLPVIDWFKHHDFEARGEHITSICNLAVDIISSSPGTDELSWWLSCQVPLTVEQTIHQLEKLLNKVTYVESGSSFDLWINHNFLPESKQTYWDLLTLKSQQTLKSFYNITSYSVVQKLFENLRDTSIDPSLEEWESRNLKSRIDFWSSYSNSFKKVRFILTARSYRLLKGNFNFATARVTVLDDTSQNNQSEICIFEFDTCYVIERFRNNFDMGVLEKSETRDKLLFVNNICNGSQVTGIQPEGSHDHINDYQYFAREYLSKTWRIRPNRDSKLAKWYRPPIERINTRTEKLQSRYGSASNPRTYY
jgi:hypothetical protein